MTPSPTYRRESAKQIAARLRRNDPPQRPVFVSERLPVSGKTITCIGTEKAA